VSQAEWEAVMRGVLFKGKDIGTPSCFRVGGTGADKVKGLDTSRFPVEQVSWEMCQEFVARANHHGGITKVFDRPGRFALPHEDQWEFACRGGRGNRRSFYWGNELNGTQANCDGNFPFGTTKGQYIERPCAVDYTNGGAYPPHPWGLCHIHGNVWEWCDDLYKQTESRVLRGGSWYFNAHNCRAALLNRKAPDSQNNHTGCRLVISLD
jgi:formylglycine-generating enzyme required for sulfatase activity